MYRGLLDNGQLYHRLDEASDNPFRLGRNAWYDARSLSYMVENDVGAMGSGLRDQDWHRVLPVLDQGELGSCTGNAGAGALGSEPYYSTVGKAALGAADDAAAGERYAVQLYADATRADGYPGVYPPDDTGSSGLAICKVLRTRGVISGYRWARSAHGYLELLQRGPVLQGMPWYRAFFEPDAHGFIDADPAWESSGVAGGHEIEAVGLELDARDAFDSVITFVNSWSTSWGDEGRFRMRLRTYEKLGGVDLKQFTVATEA